MKYLTILIIAAHGVSFANSTEPFSCKYNETNGKPTRLYERIEKGPNDWYSRYKAIQFCQYLDGNGSYVLIEEELIKGFKVLNPPRDVLHIEESSSGKKIYHIAHSVDDVVLTSSADEQSMQAVGQFGADTYRADLRLVWKDTNIDSQPLVCTREECAGGLGIKPSSVSNYNGKSCEEYISMQLNPPQCEETRIWDCVTKTLTKLAGTCPDPSPW